MDVGTYLAKCLPKLQKLIQDNYRGQKMIFWPDLAPAHYQKDVLKPHPHRGGDATPPISFF